MFDKVKGSCIWKIDNDPYHGDFHVVVDLCDTGGEMWEAAKKKYIDKIIYDSDSINLEYRLHLWWHKSPEMLDETDLSVWFTVVQDGDEDLEFTVYDGDVIRLGEVYVGLERAKEICQDLDVDIKSIYMLTNGHRFDHPFAF